MPEGCLHSFYVTGHDGLWPMSLVNPAALIIVQTVIKETHIPGYLSLKAVLLKISDFGPVCSQGSIQNFQGSKPKKLDKKRQ